MLLKENKYYSGVYFLALTIPLNIFPTSHAKNIISWERRMFLEIIQKLEVSNSQIIIYTAWK